MRPNIKEKTESSSLGRDERGDFETDFKETSMLESLIAIKGPDFLIDFWTVCVIWVMVLWAWMYQMDDTLKYPAPAELDVYEVAWLRDGNDGVIHTALFRLWHQGLIHIDGQQRLARVEHSVPPRSKLELQLYRFIARQPREVKLFGAHVHEARLDSAIEPIEEHLRHAHLLLEDTMLRSQKWLLGISAIVILGIGFVKMILGIVTDHPILFLVLSLLFWGGVYAFWVRKISSISRLGRRHLAQLQDAASARRTEEMGTNPSYFVALFGIMSLGTLSVFDPFVGAFTPLLVPDTSSSSSSGCSGGCSGSSSSCSGGCGGCGGD